MALLTTYWYMKCVHLTVLKKLKIIRLTDKEKKRIVYKIAYVIALLTTYLHMKCVHLNALKKLKNTQTDRLTDKKTKKNWI